MGDSEGKAVGQPAPLDTTTSSMSTTATITRPPAQPKKKVSPEDKVIVRFRAVGNAPIMKQNKFKITAAEQFQAIIDFLRKQLKFSQREQLFCYINQAFSPSPDEIVRNLFKLFATDNALDIYYCTTEAWG
eukprot:comp22154_c0_seq1/m.32462 comp22154_c0_seq1/g.32462  ORF comp22154_c0_seq1/g.32462 comp22154_c0_seq1/m.32462 type:complete len:131 (-) comp22154_c0_seq1:105-497(-)